MLILGQFSPPFPLTRSELMRDSGITVLTPAPPEEGGAGPGGSGQGGR